MNVLAWLLESNNRKIVSYLSYAAASLVLVFSLVWSVQIMLARGDATWIKTNINGKREDLAKNGQNVQTVPVHLVQFDVPSGYSAVEQFRALTVSTAHANRVTLEQFTAASGIVPYANHYGETVDATGYGQIHVQMTLSGNLAYVMQMLRVLSESRLPFEFGSLELTPQQVMVKG